MKEETNMTEFNNDQEVMVTGLDDFVHEPEPEQRTPFSILHGGNSKTPEEYDQDAGQVDLIQYVKDTMKELNFKDSETWANSLDHDYLRQQRMSYQRFMVNRALTLMVADVKDENGKVKDARDILYCMIDQGDVQTWKDLIKSTVLPYLNR